MSAGIRWGCRLQNCDQQLKTGELVRAPIRHVRLLSSQWDLVLSSGFLQSRERESIPGVLSLQSSSRRDRVCRINHHGCQWSEFTSCEEVGTAVRGFLPHFPKHLQWWNFNADFNKWGPIAATLTSLGLTQSLNLSCRCHTFIEFGLTQTFISAAGLGWYWRTASQDGCDCLLGGGGGGRADKAGVGYCRILAGQFGDVSQILNVLDALSHWPNVGWMLYQRYKHWYRFELVFYHLSSFKR